MDLTQIIIVCITGLLSFGGIALAIFFGLSSFRKDIIKELSDIKDKVIKIENTAEKLWDLARTSSAGIPGTITLSLKSFGTTKVSAELAEDKTVYFIETQKGNFSDEFMESFCKNPEIVKTELKLFGKEPQVSSIRPRLLKLIVPSNNPKVCTEYLSFFIKKLDEIYDKTELIKAEFEKGIEV